MIPVSPEQLQALAEMAPAPDPKSTPSGQYKGTGQLLDLDRWIPGHGLIVATEKPWGTGRRMILAVCPFNPDHADGSAVITQSAEGFIGFKCHHNSCENKHRRDVRELLELGAYDRRSDGFNRNGRTTEPAPGQEPDYRQTDVGNGKRLVAANGSDIRYCFRWNTWLYWTGVRWERDNSGELPRQAKSVFDALFDQATTLYREAAESEKAGDSGQGAKLKARADSLWKHAHQSEASARIAAMLEMAKSEPGIAIQPEELDLDPWALCVSNGTIDLRTAQLRPHRREDLITMLAPVSYEANAVLALWDQFLTEAVPDPETRAYIQRCAGATLVGKADDDVLLVCHGPGGTGKGTFLNGLQHTLGDYAAAAELATFTTARDAHAPQPDMARLKGCRMVAISEVNTGDSVTLLKKVTGGDPIVTRNHHERSYQFIPQFTLWIICNDRPKVPDNDSGMWRRMREIPFTVKFPVPDTSIRQILTNPEIAGPAILAWAVQGCLDWQQDGLGNSPHQVIEATEAYRADMNPLAEWLEENTVVLPQAWTPFKEWFADYQAWAKEANIRHPMGRKAFGKRIGDDFEPKKFNGVRGNLGIGLKPFLLDISQGVEVQIMPTGHFEAENPVDPHIYSSHKEKPGDQTSQMSSQAQAKHDGQMSSQART